MIISKNEHDVFIAYYQQTGSDFAKYLKKGLQENGFNAFLDNTDIPKVIQPKTAEWRKIRDRALKNCQRFILIMTKGFNARKELLSELRLAMNLGKERIHCKHEDLDNSDLVVEIDNKLINLSESEYQEFDDEPDLLRKLLKILNLQKKSQQNRLPDFSEDKSKLEITNLNMEIVKGDLRVTFRLWNRGNRVIKLSSIEGIAIDEKGNEVSPRAREPGDDIAIGTCKMISLNFKHYNENYEEIIIIKKYNDQTEQGNFKISL